MYERIIYYIYISIPFCIHLPNLYGNKKVGETETQAQHYVQHWN